MKTHILIIFLSIFSLTTILGQCSENIKLSTQAEVDSFVLNNLCSIIEGDLFIGDGDTYNYIETDINDLSGLQIITSISGDFDLRGNIALESLFGLDNLENVGGSFRLFDNNIKNFEGLGSLTSIGNGFSVYNNNNLINFEGLINLTNIGHKFNLFNNENLINFEGLINLTNIGDEFTVHSNGSLTSFKGLINLTDIGRGFTVNFNDGLSNFEGLENLTTIDGGDDIDLIGLDVSYNDNLINFEGLNNLTSILGNFFATYNKSLINFEGLENCTNFTFEMYITDNPNLVSLSYLENLIVPGLAELILVYNNLSLEFCCPLISFEDFSTVLLYNNTLSCDTYDAIFSFCTETKLQAQAFHDENENGIYDNSEQFLVQNITLESSGAYGYLDQMGVNNFILLEFGNYTLSYDDSSPLWTIDPAYNYIEIAYQNSTFQDTIIYFPLTSVADIASQRVDLTSSITRCNQETNYWLTYSNSGTVTTSGVIELIPDDLPEFISSDPPVDSTSNDGKLYWFYNDLYPTHIEKIHLIYAMPGVDDLGEMINFEANIKTNEGNAGHRALLSSELICAYDPNDKLHTPSGYGKENYTLFGDTLEYTIRFQNTGNDTAFNVEIRDELSELLNLSTFETISSSHNVETQIDLESRIATFKFNDIYLPDSFVNEPASHGFIKYQILGNEGLNENSDIKNTASIYFDENPAIVTNTVNNRMVSELPSMPVVSANPSMLDFGEISLNNPVIEPQILTISNLGDLPLEINAFEFGNAVFDAGELQNLTIEGGKSEEIPIYFKPTTVGEYLSELVLQSNVGDLTINLSGKATMATGLTTFHQTKVQIYPNPSEGHFTLKSEGEIIENLSVQNSLGELILSQKVNNDLFEVDLTSHSKGLYFIIIETKDAVIVERVVVY